MESPLTATRIVLEFYARRGWKKKRKFFERHWAKAERHMFKRGAFYYGFKFKVSRGRTLLWVDPYTMDCLYVTKDGSVCWSRFVGTFC